MRKNHVWTLGIYFVVGIVLLGAGIYLMRENVEYYDTLVWATGFGLAFSAAVNLFLEYRNTRPENREAYEAKLQEQQINIKDERKQSLRQLSVYRTFQIFILGGLVVGTVLIWFRVTPVITWTIFAVVVGEYIMASVIYKYLCKKM